MKRFIFALAALALAGAAHADDIGHVHLDRVSYDPGQVQDGYDIREVKLEKVSLTLRAHGLTAIVNLGCATYTNDAGCSTQSQYAIRSDGVTQGSASHTVGEDSTGFYCAYYSAQAGQLPTYAAVNPGTNTSDPTYIRNNDLHADNANIPGCEPYYKIGPDADANLTPIDLYNTAGHLDQTNGMCYFNPTGGTDSDSGASGGPALVCQVPGGVDATPKFYTISGYDFSTFSTDATKHTRSTILNLIPQYGTFGVPGVSNITLTVENVYFCNCDATNRNSRAIFAAIVGGNAYGTPIRNLIIGNAYFDGGFRNRGGDDYGSWKFVDDHRSPYDGSLVSLEIHDSLIYDIGHDVVTGDGLNGSFTFQDSAVWRFCQADCHSEIAELATGNGSATFHPIPLTLYKNFLTMNPATYLGGAPNTDAAFALDNTAPIYNNGSFHRIQYTAFNVQHGHFIVNGYGCSNMQQIYTPASPCSGGYAAGSAAIYLANAATMDFTGNVMDGTGTYYCMDSDKSAFYGSIIGGGQAGRPTASVVAGNNYITVLVGDNNFGPDGNYWPDYGKISGRAYTINSTYYPATAGFIDTYITGYGTARDAPTFSATLSGGVITLATAGNLDPGQELYLADGTDLGTIQTGGSGTHWTTSNTTASYPAGTQFKSLNPTSSCTPGMSRGCGTYMLSVTEPVSVPDMSVLYSFSGIGTLTGSGNYSIGGTWSGGGHRAWPVSNLNNPGQQNCT